MHAVSAMEQEQVLDIKKLISRGLRNWYWFVLAILISGGLAYAYNRYTTPVYQLKSALLFEGADKGSSAGMGALGSQTNLFQGLGGLGSMTNIYNQMVVLKSTPIVTKTLESLSFEVSYFKIGRIVQTELFNTAPFYVQWDKSHRQLLGVDFMVSISANGQITVSASAVENQAEVYDYSSGTTIKKLPTFSFSKTINAGTKLVADDFAFTILLNEHFDPEAESTYKFRFHSTQALVNKYHTAMEIDITHEFSSILDISLREMQEAKGIHFLNKLMEVYQVDNLDKKNDNANRTIQFISTQLASISESLENSENEMEVFQSANQVVDLSMQGQQMLEKMTELDKEIVTLETQNKYFNYLRDYIQHNRELETVIAPSAMGIQDPLLNSLILQLNALITQKSSQTSIRKDSRHPTIIRLNAQIESVKNSLFENTTNIISQSDLALNDTRKRMRTFEAEARRLPATERNFVNIERKYKLNNETYTFLLQKLSEAQIAKASNIPDSQVIEEAYSVGSVGTKKKTIYAMALLLGLAFPVVIMFLSDFFRTRIVSQEEIEELSKYPVIGHVFFNNQKDYKSRTVVLDKPNSQASEPYQVIRAKLNLMTKGMEKPVIAVSSTFPKEGKSYNAINIASIFALTHKSVVLLDLDLRNSKMIEEFNLKTDLGIVNYIIGEASITEITVDTKHPNLKLIPAGSIPPNPAEMLSDKNLWKLIKELRLLYDVVVIDTPPIGYVADLFELNDTIDANVFIVRHKFTHKQGLKMALAEVEKHNLKGVGIVVNGIKNNQHGYGYGYGNKASKKWKLMHKHKK